MDTETNYKAVVRYVGTGFAGWQVQPNARTVQGELMEALSRITGNPVTVQGASRTDAGVHALGQVCSFALAEPADSERLRRSLSQMLGPEIRVVSMETADAGFHPRKLATAKRYWYALDLGREPDPFSAPFALHAPRDIDVCRLRTLCARFEGERDFAGFEGSRAAPKHSTVRNLYSVSLNKGGVVQAPDAVDLWRLEFHGNGFLYKMVRNITGTLIDVARGHLPEPAIDERLASPGPYRGYTAPGHGLTLMEVEYGGMMNDE
ncbi:MAG: tRNA pseudouridine synthase A [Candidatus Hydrogenedentota bacterium]